MYLTVTVRVVMGVNKISDRFSNGLSRVTFRLYTRRPRGVLE
jgi:hypothetical protein